MNYFISYLQTLHFNILTSISPICSCTQKW